jgi:hypothetical protein
MEMSTTNTNSFNLRPVENEPRQSKNVMLLRMGQLRTPQMVRFHYDAQITVMKGE